MMCLLVIAVLYAVAIAFFWKNDSHLLGGDKDATDKDNQNDS